MGYLVVQGLAVVLLADLGISTAIGKTTIVRSVCQEVGLWKETPEFEKLDLGKKSIK